MKDFWFFAYERERVRHARDKGARRPWTSDPVIAARFFTNTFREDDPGTAVAVEILSHAQADGSASPDGERLWNLLLYRRFNREETWRSSIGYIPWDGGFQDRCAAVLARLESVDATPGRALFTDAHQVYPLVQLADRGPKLLPRVMAASWEHDLPAANDLAAALGGVDARTAFRTVKKAKLPGIAGFLAWQLVLDLRYGPDPIVTASDDEWAPVQAGCRVGLTLHANWPRKGLVGTDVGAGSDLERLETIPVRECEQMMVRMRNRQRHEFAARGLDFRAVSGGRDMTVASLEHTLCEAQKYWGIARGMPHSRRAFR